MPRLSIARLAILPFAALLLAPLHAQQFPSKPIRIISTTSAGGVNDTICRAYAASISQAVGQNVIVENRPGGGSIIGMQALAASAPDGYTVAITTTEPLVYNPLLYTKLPYDPDRDFVAVSQISRGGAGAVIIGSANLPASNFREVIAYAKANPGKLNFATWGAGSLPAIYAAWINRQNGTDIQPIAYKGAVPSIASLLSGEVHLTYQSLGFVLPNIRAGKLKAIAIAGDKRSALLPEVAALGEFNSDPGIESMFGVFAHGRTPPEIVSRLNAEFVRATATPTVQKMWTAITMEPVGSSPAEFSEAIRVARANAARVFKALDIRPSAAPE
jgi:tripartite-type tricarboxylate transporter receptor subunit TctC